MNHDKEGEELDADALETATPNNNVINQPGVIQQPGVIVVDIPPEDYNEEGSTSSQQQQQQDDSTTNSIWENGTPTTLDNNGNNNNQQQQGETQTTVQQQISQQVYEASFPTQPESIFDNQPPRAATTFALFSSPTRFNPNTIHTTNTHYLNNALEGMIYLDVNGDGIRGSTLDRTNNAVEFDTGVGGVQSALVHCHTNEIVMPISVSQTVSYNEDGAIEGLQSVNPQSGTYTFDTNSISPGRYYIMYKSPKDYRLNANILPLDREEGSGECIPKGGEGNGYIQDVYNKGDLDWNGYCGRTIGCFEVGPKFDLKKDFANLQLNEEQDNQFEGTIDNLVALPAKNMLNIGVTRDPWPLNTNQFADGKVTFSFPDRYSSQDLEDAVPSDFEVSSIKKSLEVTMATLFAKSNNKIGDFDVKGVNFIGGEIFTKSRRRMLLRGGRDLQRDNVGGAVGVTYTFTTRGKYSPPPYEQLGTLVSDSINADPVGLVKSLKDRENPNVQLPEVFDEVDDANVRHLTLKNNEQLLTAAGGMGLYGSLQVQAANEGVGSLASWASIPVAILSASIASLVGVLLFRRVFTRRQKQVSNGNPLTTYMKKGSVGFTASRRRSEDSDMKKKKSGRGKSKRGFAVARRGSDDDKKKKRGYRDDDDDDEYRAAIAESSRSQQRESDRSSQRASRGRRRSEGSDNGRTISNSSRSSSDDRIRYSAPVNGRRNNNNRHSSRRRGTID